MAVLPVDGDGRDKPGHDGEGRGFHLPRLIHGGNAGAALAVTEWGRASFRGRLPAVGSYLA
jgi:hypothetical protein